MEIAQEAYVRVLSMADSEKIVDMESYLFGIAKNIHIDRVRNARIGIKVQERSGCSVAYGGATTEACYVGPEDEMVAKDMLNILKRTIEDLPPKCQMAFLLYKFEGVCYTDIAERMGLTESMVRKYVLRGLRDCQQRLEV